MQRYKVLIKLAWQYFSGEDAGLVCSVVMAKTFVDSALADLGMSLPGDMSLSDKIQWIEAL